VLFRSVFERQPPILGSVGMTHRAILFHECVLLRRGHRRPGRHRLRAADRHPGRARRGRDPGDRPAARREAIICLEAFNSDNHHNAVAEFPQAGLVLEGELEKQLNENPAVKVEDNYRKILADSRGSDARAGRTLRGPHRTDLIVHHKPSGMLAALCSTGEQKALLIGLVLAHGFVIKGVWNGYAPLLLLDEIAAHLDQRRRAAMFKAILTLGTQAWMTGTDEHLFEAIQHDARCYRINQGSIEPVTR